MDVKYVENKMSNDVKIDFYSFYVVGLLKKPTKGMINISLVAYTWVTVKSQMALTW